MMANLFAVVAGNEACNAKCPFCVSRMTPSFGVGFKKPEINWSAFEKACFFVKSLGVESAMITSKGEPALFPEQITGFLKVLKRRGFSNIELQTNGILIWEKREEFEKHLQDWFENGLSLIAISIVHFDAEKNRQIYLPHKQNYVDLPELIDFLHSEKRRFNVRLACIMLKNFIDNGNKVKELIEFSRRHSVEQLTLRPVHKPNESRNLLVERFVEQNSLGSEQLSDVGVFLENEGVVVRRMSYGGIVFDVHNQNVCLTNSLTFDSDLEKIRQLIFFPDGSLRYDWERTDAVIDLEKGISKNLFQTELLVKT